MRDENPTVYTSSSGRMCPKCRRPIDACICKKTVAIKSDGIVRVFRDSKQRKGKTVTVITGIQLSGEPLHALHSGLKRLCGSGGAIKEGNLEIQGDHRDVIFEELKKRGFTVKLAGG
jgi:translation initiation factor 1